MIHLASVAGLERVTWSQGNLIVAFLPQLGGKLCTLRRKSRARNVLYEPHDLPYRLPEQDGVFEDHDTSGFDECFPTVDACPDPRMPTRRLPDHGAVWSRPVTWSVDGEVLSMVSDLPGARFSRTFRVEGDTLVLGYSVMVEESGPALWSAHPLLAVSEGSRIYLPSEVASLYVQWSSDGHLGERGAVCAWPGQDATRIDHVAGRSAGRAKKLFTDALRAGWCAIVDGDSGEAVTFRFDPADTPFLGLWICEGGWPRSRAAKHHTVALEPCSGRPDALDEAARRKECWWLDAGIPRTWSLRVGLSDGFPSELTV